MRNQNDPTIKIVLGISLFVFVLTAYLGWRAYKAKEKLRTDALPERKDNLKTQKKNFNKKLERLRSVSEVLGWRYLPLNMVPSEDHEREYLKDGLYRFETYPEIEKLKSEGNLVEKARGILEDAGYSSSFIDQVTSDPVRTEEVLQSYYKAVGSQRDKAITNIQTMAEHLNRVRKSLLLLRDEVDLEGISNKGDWKVEEDVDPATFKPRVLTGDEEGVTVATLLTKMNEFISTLHSKRDNIKNQIESTRKSYYTFTRKYGDQQKVSNVISNKRQEVSSLRSDIESLREDVLSNQQLVMENLEEEGVKVWNKQQEKNKLLDKQTRVIEKKKDRIVELEKKLKKLREQERKTTRRKFKNRADGSILTVNQDAMTGFIDIGRKDGLFRGTEFEVFDTIKGGRRVQKGTIEVTDRFEDYSRFKIKNQIDALNKPIESEDFVRSEKFSKQDVKVFVFAGQMQGQYTRSMLRELIKKNGHRVEPDVTNRTNFLVIGSGYENDRDYEKARNLGIDTISQKQLQRMLEVD